MCPVIQCIVNKSKISLSWVSLQLCGSVLQCTRCCSCSVLQKQLLVSLCVSMLPSFVVYQVLQLQCVAIAVGCEFLCLCVAAWCSVPGVAVAVSCKSTWLRVSVSSCCSLLQCTRSCSCSVLQEQLAVNFSVSVFQYVALCQGLRLQCGGRTVDYECECILRISIFDSPSISVVPTACFLIVVSRPLLPHICVHNIIISHTRTRSHTRITHALTHTHTYSHAHTSTHTHTHAPTLSLFLERKQIYPQSHAHKRTSNHVCVHERAHALAHIHTHTCVHTHK